MKYYVYALDTTDEQITAALSCPDERTAKQAYRIAKRKFETEYGGTNSFHFGFAGVGSGVCIDYTRYNGWHTSSRFEVDDFDFAVQQAEKFLSKEKKQGYATYHAHKDMDFLRFAKSAMTELFLGFDPSDVSAHKPENKEPPVKTIPPWKKLETVIEGTPALQSDVADCPQQIRALTGAGVPDIVAAYQASIEDSDGTPANVNVVNQLTKADIADSVAEGIMKAKANDTQASAEQSKPITALPVNTPANTNAAIDTRSAARKRYDSLDSAGKNAIKQEAALYACKTENLHLDITDIAILFGLPEKSLNRDPYKSIIKRGRIKAIQERQR